MGEGVDELTVGVLLEALQCHGPVDKNSKWPFCTATSWACPWPHRARRPGARRRAVLRDLATQLRMGEGEGYQGCSGATTAGEQSITPQRWETHRHGAHVAYGDHARRCV